MLFRRHVFPLIFAIAMFVLTPVAAVLAEVGFWQKDSVQFLRPDDKKAQAGDEWDWQAGWRFKIYSISDTELSWGGTHPNPSVHNTFWSEVKNTWTDFPQALQPGDKLVISMGAKFLAKSEWTETAVRCFKMSGVDGDQRELGGIPCTKTDATASTNPYTIPEGTSKLPDSRLQFLVSVPEHGRALFSYKWVTGKIPEGKIPGHPTVEPVAKPKIKPLTPQEGKLTVRPQTGNLALGKTATQSSTYSGTGVYQGPRLANDGKNDGRDPHDLIMTAVENQPWWQVDLGSVQRVQSVRLFNRHNPPELGSSKDIMVLTSMDGKSWTNVYSHNKTPWQILNVPVGGAARFVRVQLAGRGGISLFEVEVY